MSRQDREKWNARYAAAAYDDGEDCPFATLQTPHPFVVAQADLLPTGGTALDLAGGVGRNAIWLAQQGMNVTLLDISHLALERAGIFAQQEDVSIKILEHDAADEGIPEGAWDVIVSSYFLRRELFAQFPNRLTPGGLLIFVHGTASNLKRHTKPPREFLLEDDELPSLIQGLDVLSYEEGWIGEPPEDARHETQLVARKPT
ncbi:MAG: methyltransferase domain-containing protein [Pirellulales bacterium]|nr:methyltransferase domain-containing protein [Pirellulales bacterium]